MTGQEPILLMQMAILLAVVGAFAGVLAGLLGVGGGIVLVPAFFYVFSALGFSSPQLMQLCVATSLATIIVTSAPGITIGAALGVILVSQLRTTTLQVIFGALALCVGLYMAFGKSHWRLGDQMPSGIRRLLLSPLIGGLSVLIGVGGGSFGVPLMTLHATPIHRAVATAAGFGLLIAVPSVIGFLFVPMPEDIRPPFTVGVVNGAAFALVVLMTTLTAPLGARLAHRLDPALLRRVFAVFLLLVAANMLRKAVGA